MNICRSANTRKM